MSPIKDFLSYISTTQLQRAAAILLIAFLGIGMGVGFSVAISDARAAADKDLERQTTVYNKLQTDLASQLTTASALASTVGAFVMATVTTPANLSAPAVDRIRFVDASAFDRLGQKVFFQGITSMVIVSGGVVSQMYPAGAARYGLDMYNSATYLNLYPKYFTSKGTVTSGPSMLVSRPVYGIFIWFPIHVSNITNMNTFWGTSYILIEIPRLLNSMNVSAITKDHDMDYVMWFTTVQNGTVPTVVSESDSSVRDTVMSEGMRMRLPISEEDRSSYFAMHPKGGSVSPIIKAGIAVTIVIVTIIGTVAVIFLIYLFAFSHFLVRHRRAPSSHSQMYMAAFALRGAQPTADHSPLVAVQMFTEFNMAVRRLAIANGCYPVCQIGDRCVLVVSKSPEALMTMAQAAVLEISVRGSVVSPAIDRTTTNNNNRRLSNQPSTSYVKTATCAKTAITSQITEDMSESSFIGAATCHASVACHTVTATSVYDEAKDLYFYGSAAQLGKLCGALDMAKCGEVCWTDVFEKKNQKLCRGAASAALSSHIVSENGGVVLHVASWWAESGDERDNEDPSTAMAVLSDAYVRRMTVIVSQGKVDAKERRRKDGEETRSGSSNLSNEATALTRTATILHVAVISGDEKTALEVVRRIVSEEKGAVVSAHEATIVAAFNLLSAGGHHQIRAADTVMRLREALPSTHFACSIQHGKVSALIVDGLVMCTGETVARGRALLQAAVTLSSPNTVFTNDDLVTYFTSGSEAPTPTAAKSSQIGLRCPSSTPNDNGLCLLFCHSELSSIYDCEAVDAVTFCHSRPRVMFRLVYKRATQGNDDEWMYKLKDEEDQSPFALVNLVFQRMAADEQVEAARLWNTADKTTYEISSYAKVSIERHLLKG